MFWFFGAYYSMKADISEWWQSDVTGKYDPEHVSGRPRPKPSITSYLSVYRNTEKIEPVSFDWSSLGTREEAYAPNPDLMSNSILRQILANPTRKLPARYNSSLLHILEDYRRARAEVSELVQRLQAEIETHRKDHEQFGPTSPLFIPEQNVESDAPPPHGLIARQGKSDVHTSQSSKWSSL